MIEVIKTPEISLNECTLCDSILVTYTLVGEEPVTVEVEKNEDEYTIEGIATIEKVGDEWIITDGGTQMFVAVASSGTDRISTSENGTDWTLQDTASSLFLSSVYGNGLFVAVGVNAVATSDDGVTWTNRTPSESNTWSSVAYGNSIFVAVSRNGTNRVMTSIDGITWVSRSASENNSWQGVIFADGLFVAVASDGTNRVMTSADGVTWSNQTASQNNDWTSITYGNGLFVAVAQSGTNRVMTSPDGTTWTNRTASEANQWMSITYGNGLFVAVSLSGTNRVMTSINGTSWTSRSASEANQWRSVTYGNGLFVAVSSNGTNRVMKSTNGTTWTSSSITANDWYGVTFGGAEIYATLSEDTECPFGTYTIEEESIFESFEVAPSECYTSKWSAVHHPIKWELQRKDAEVISTSLSVTPIAGNFRLQLSTTPPTGVVVGLNIDFYDSLGVKRSGIIQNITGNFLIVSNNYVLGVVVEFAIFPTLYNNYYIETEVENIGTIRTIPNPQGKATIDVSAWLRTQTAFENTYNYASLTAVDLGQSGSYRLRFRENYNFQIGAFGSYTSKFYWSNSAKQIRDAYGSNMIEYVTNLNTLVKFLSVFNRPTNFISFPFSLSWINSGQYSGRALRRFENNTTATNIAQFEERINRLLVTDTCESVSIQFGTTGTFILQGYLTETKQIKINQTCLERPLAVSWLNTLGGREHWVFSYNQIHTLDTQSGATYQPNIDNLETARTNIFDLQKFAQPKISVGANVDVEDIEGLKTILYSICVEIQTAQGWIGVRPETGSFKILETKDTKATIEMTFVLPDINIQTR